MQLDKRAYSASETGAAQGTDGYWMRYIGKMRVQIISLLAVFSMATGVGCGSRDKTALQKELQYRQSGINEMSNKDYAAAAKTFQKALDQSLAVIGDLEIDICYYKIAAQYNSNDIEEALKTCQALIDYDENDASAYYLRGSIYLKNGDLKRCKADFDKIFKLDENNYQYYTSIYESYKSAGKDKEAEKVLSKVLGLRAKEPEEYRYKGYAFYLQGDYAKAMSSLDKAINMKDTQALLYLAQVYDAKKEKKKARELYESYASSNANDADSLNILGCKWLREKEYKKALETFQMALKIENLTNEQELRRNEIVTLEYLARFKEARTKMKAYVKDFPDDTKAKREYEFLKTR